MSNLDVEALFVRNPQVNRARLREDEKQIAQLRKISRKKEEGTVVSPYGGRRLLKDEKSKDSSFQLQSRRTS